MEISKVLPHILAELRYQRHMAGYQYEAEGQTQKGIRQGIFSLLEQERNRFHIICPFSCQSLIETMTNPKYRVEKLSPNKSSEDGHAVLRGSSPKDSVSTPGVS